MAQRFDGTVEPEQTGAVLVFKDGVSPEEAQKALAKLQDILQYQPNINTFNPNWGGPVWYIP